MLTRDSTEQTDPRVVPSLAGRRSHHAGGTHIKVVPRRWRATPARARTRCDLRTYRRSQACRRGDFNP